MHVLSCEFGINSSISSSFVSYMSSNFGRTSRVLYNQLAHSRVSEMSRDHKSCLGFGEILNAELHVASFLLNPSLSTESGEVI